MSIQNETLEAIASRFTCRAFTDQPVEREKLEAIALAGLQSPTSNNRQGWRFIIVTDKDYIDLLDEGTVRNVKSVSPEMFQQLMSRTGKALYNAPALIVIVIPRNAPYNVEMDSGIACANMVLAATSLGLGTCIHRIISAAILGPEKRQVYEELGIPEGFEFSISILVGYSEYLGAPHAVDTGKVSFIEKVERR